MRSTQLKTSQEGVFRISQGLNHIERPIGYELFFWKPRGSTVVLVAGALRHSLHDKRSLPTLRAVYLLPRLENVSKFDADAP